MGTTSNKDLKKVNAIAYDEDFRQAIEKSHELLGTDITDFYQEAWETGMEGVEKALEALKNYSEATADLSLALIEARDTKKDLTKEEEEMFERAKQGTTKLGEIQNKVNKMIAKMGQREKLAAELMKDSNELVDMILSTQDYLRDLRIDMNAYGPLSKNRDIASLYYENKLEQKDPELS